jgi:hypothetical protein
MSNEEEYSFNFDITSKELAKQACTKERPNFQQDSEHLFAFQYDISPTFAKKFGYATVKKFWSRLSRDANPFYYQQLIPDGPCRQFYDFEFDRDANKDKEIDTVYASFLKLRSNGLRKTKEFS